MIAAAVLFACATVPAAKPVEAVKPAAKAIFTPSDADDALHSAAGIIYEWWYLDATFDNGYAMSTSWQITDPKFVG